MFDFQGKLHCWAFVAKETKMICSKIFAQIFPLNKFYWAIFKTLHTVNSKFLQGRKIQRKLLR